MTEQAFGFGCIPDLPDERDRLFGKSGIARPPRASVRHPSVRAKDQGPTQSCTGQAIAQAVRTALLNARIECPELSAPYNYFLGRAEWGGELVDGGSHLRTGIKAVNRGGLCTEERWPFDPMRINERPPWNALRTGFDIKFLLEYERVTDIDGVRDAIWNRKPVVGGWSVDSAFGSNSGPDVIESMGPEAGLHALMAEDYDDATQTCGMLNSYGESFRVGGRVRFKYDVVESGFDLWAMRVRLQ